MKLNKTIKQLLRASLFTALLSMQYACVSPPKQDLSSTIESQIRGMVDSTITSTRLPRCTNEDGSVRMTKSNSWTSGFFPGVLWYQYEMTGDSRWQDLARQYTERLAEQQYSTKTHDLGFMMYCSYGNGYRLTGDTLYRNVLVNSARSLATRYSDKVKSIRSWDHNRDKWDFPVIIDNMMNLELIFWAAKETNDTTLYNVAYNHAQTTLKNHFRPDHSCYHVIGYNPNTGAVEKKNTHQGYAHESSWARGQAWAIYGFAMAYRETGDERFLAQATNTALYMINNDKVTEDAIPYWDLSDPTIPNAPRDASAAAVISSGLYELSTYVDDANKAKFIAFADKILASLSSDAYLAEAGTNNNFILKHSVGNMPKRDEVDVPIIYADYYYMEALLRSRNLKREVHE